MQILTTKHLYILVTIVLQTKFPLITYNGLCDIKTDSVISI